MSEPIGSSLRSWYEMTSNTSVMLWTLQGSLRQKLETVAAAGMHRVGFVSEPSRWSSRERAEAEHLLQQTGIEPALMSATPNWRTATVSMLDREQRPNLLREIGESLRLAQALEISTLLLLPGNRIPDVPRETQLAELTETCKRCAELAAAAERTLVLEPLNDRDHPAYFLTDCLEAADVVREVASPNLRLLFDVYHQQAQCGNAAEALAEAIDRTAVIHLADEPGRHEPSSGLIDWRKIAGTMRAAAYAGEVSFEFFPSGDPIACLNRARETLEAA